MNRRMRGTGPPKLKTDKKPKGAKLYHKANNPDDDWQPTFESVIKMLLSIRIASALWGIINGCDEVYNSWEPLHLFLYGDGFQTWEYSPIYALRSYFYIYLHYIPASLFVYLFGESKIVVFTLVRLTIGVFCLCGEYYAFNAICKKINVSTGRLFILFSICSSGIFFASTSFVPQALCMACTFYILGAYLNEHWTFGIFCVVFSTLVGWSFSLILIVPIGSDMFFLKGMKLRFIFTFIVIGSIIGFIQFVTDNHYFGSAVMAPLNNLLANLVSRSGNESPLFYFKNLFNSWNIALLFAPLGLPLSFKYFMKVMVPEGTPTKFGLPRNMVLYQNYIPIFLMAMITIIWLLLFSCLSHKEERYLFPIYPFIAFFAALACDAINRLWIRDPEKDELEYIYVVLIVFAMFSVSRTYSIYNNYGSHVEVYKALHEELSVHEDLERFNDPIRICVGKEWHRFPSSFFIPQNVLDVKQRPRKVELRFLESEFRGLLPKPFKKENKLINVTRHVPSGLNNRNEEDVSIYVDLKSCDYVIDVDMPATEREPDFREMPKKWKPVVSMPFIDAARSHYFHRAFYVPFISVSRNAMTNCTIYRKIVY